MRHYEIVFLIHPDQSDQTQPVLDKFSSIVTESGGKVHRLENIGRRKLAYPIQDQIKASYALLNIECKREALEEIKSSFQFNDSIIRNLILSRSKSETDLSALSTQTEEEDVGYIKEENKKIESLSKSQEDEANEKKISGEEIALEESNEVKKESPEE